ncbi:MAG: Asp-tRNA(Asn)/Glu-tRNA(Gln) amidotransferase subunit GatB [Lysobacterales bacterium]
MSAWQPVIGLEVHAQLATRSKIFSPAATRYGAEANTQAHLIDLGLPGVLPVPNREAVRLAVRFGLAVDAHIAPRSHFERKNYFYPDLPKGYQISQFAEPIVAGGRVRARRDDGSALEVQLTRAHLEEDAGKSLHDAFASATGVDYNRAGTPLLEIVTEPVLHSAADAVAYLKALHTLVRWLGICDGNMQEGSFRCDANVSVRPAGSQTLGVRSEVKNVNSFRFVEKAIAYEIERHIRLYERGERPVQETRLYDAARDQTRPMRSKEYAEDYRYFPDPDLPPLAVSAELLAQERAELPELPADRFARYIDVLGLSEYDAALLTADRALADYFETVLAVVPGEAKRAANWVLVELGALLNARQLNIEQCPLPASRLGGLLALLAGGQINGRIAKQVFEAMVDSDEEAAAVIARLGLQKMDDSSALVPIIDEIIARHPEQVAQYQSGQDKLLQFFIGQVMRATRGQADAGVLASLLAARLSPPK